jgi:hypothetical protein
VIWQRSPPIPELEWRAFFVLKNAAKMKKIEKI